MDMRFLLLLLLFAGALQLMFRNWNTDPYEPYEEKGPLLTRSWGTEFDLDHVRPHRLHLYAHEVDDARYNILMIHGTSHHGGRYEDFAPKLSTEKLCNVYAVDLKGHGKSGGPRGVFRFEDWLDDIKAAVEFVRGRNDLKVVLLGASQGGEVSFHALNHANADADISLNIMLNKELPMKKIIELTQGPVGTALEWLLGDTFKVPLTTVINFKKAFDYDRDPVMYEQRARDPLMVWKYGYSSYRSVFTYEAPFPASNNKKPVLVTCGENDPAIYASHCTACHGLIGGDKTDLYIIPQGSHQPMFWMPKHFIDVVDKWVTERVLEDRIGDWSPPALLGDANNQTPIVTST
eukprot:Rmarinus@m.7858